VILCNRTQGIKICLKKWGWRDNRYGQEYVWKAISIEYYEKFLDLWKDADPGILEVTGAKKRLAEFQTK
jgi:hypothetical protein